MRIKMFSQVKKKVFWFCIGLSMLMTQNCTGAKQKNDNFPPASSYVGYNLVDARHVQNLSLSVKQGAKLGIVVRDLSLTAFTNMETPTLNPKNLMNFEGVDRCCSPKSGLIGASGLLVYKFQVLRPGTATIKLTARHKGLDISTEHYDSDLVTTINLTIQ